MDKQHTALVESIYREHKDHIYNYIHRMCNDADLSHDIVQATFIKILSDPKVADVEHRKAYLFTIARNTLYDEMKRKKPVYFEDSEQLQDVAGIEEDTSLQDQTEEHVLAKTIDKAITNMPEKFRELMLLRYTEDLSIQEIAHITDRKLSDIKVNLHRARLAFENRFTATMYSKVAASRKRCDTLIHMIAPYGEKDIPMADIPKIEMHIANCADCNEDAKEMKRRRELFALLPILVAPALWEDIMKEAQASTLAADTSTQRTDSQNTNTLAGKQAANDKTAPSPTPGSAPIHTAANTAANTVTNTVTKASSLKLASIAAVVVIIIVGGFILSQYLTTEDKTPLLSQAELTDTTTPSPSPLKPSGNPPSGSTPSGKAPSMTVPSGQPATTPIPAPQAADSNLSSQAMATDKQPSSATQAPEHIAKASPPQAIPQPGPTPKKLTQDTPVENQPDQDKPAPDESNGKWLYNGPPISATVIDQYDEQSDPETATIYLSKYGMWSKSTDESNQDLLSITNFTQRKGWILQLSRKVYVDVQLDDEGNSKLFPPPVTSQHMDNLYDRKPCREFDKSKKLGMDTIDGRPVEKWGCLLARTEQTTMQWYDPNLQLVIGEENYETGKSTVKHIKSWEIDKTIYDIPDGYKEVTPEEFFALTTPPSSPAVAQPIPFQSMANVMQCTSGCVDQMNECRVTMKPQCQNAEDKSACFEPCDAAYSTCLGSCQPAPMAQ